MFSSPRAYRRCIASLVTFALMMQMAAVTAIAQQASEDATDSKRQDSVSGKHVKEQIGEILKRARAGLERINKEVKDYECMLIKQELVDGKLQDMQFMQIKIRHEQRDGDKVTVPFSVYVKFRKPKRVAGREVIFVEGRNNGDLIARAGGTGRRANMTVQLPPHGDLAMEGNRYPITEIGVVTLVERLIGFMEKEIESDNCVIKIFEDAKLDDRPCRRFELSLLKKKPNSRFKKAHLFVDNEYRIPTFYAAYDWPEKKGDKLVLLEAYTYRNIKMNVGLTDKDFDPDNPQYKFTKVKPLPEDGKTP